MVIYEDDHVFAFLDIAPRALGHTVVISKVHGRTLGETPDSEVGPLFLGVKKVADRISTVLQAEGLTIGINQGEVAGQAIGHLHVHVIPRRAGDGGGSIHTIVNNSVEANLEDIQNKLKIT